MDTILLFAVLGLGTGALIAGIAVGLVLIYRGSGIINVGTGAIAMLSAYAFWALTTGEFGEPMGTAPAFVIAVAFAVVVGIATELLVFRPLRTSSPLAKLVASLGILLIAQSSMLLAFGPTPKTQPAILTDAEVGFLGIDVPVAYFILAGIVGAAAAALTLFYRFSRFGLETRASFENESAAMWIGLSPDRLAMVNTLLASAVVGALGVLAAPVTSVDPELLPLQVVPALAAALLANFTSIPIACLAGLGLGALQNIMYYVSTQSWFPTDDGTPLPGTQPLLIFIITVIAVALRGSKLPMRGDFIERALPVVPRPENLRRTALLTFGLGVACLIVFPFDFRQALVNSAIAAVLLVSLVVITGYVGQVSVVQLALSGVAGFTMSHLSTDLGIGFPGNAIIGVVVATVLGLGIGLSALRVRGVQLAIVSLAATVAINRFWFGNKTWGAGQGGAPVDQPEIFGINLGTDAAFRGLDGKFPSPVLGIVVMAIAVLICVFVAHLRRTNFGQQMVVVRSNESAAASVGINVRRVKILAFGLSSFIAGVAGVMYAFNFGSVSANRFTAIAALSIIAFAYIGGITMVSGAVIGGTITVAALFPYAWQKFFGLSGSWALLIGGVFLIFNLIFYPDGVAGASRRKRDMRRLGLAPPSYFKRVVSRAATSTSGGAGDA